MTLYLILILTASSLTVTLNALSLGWLRSFWQTAATVAALFALDALVALIVHAVPEEKVNPFAKVFSVSQRERRRYERLGIRKWKDVIPESGKALVGFDKRKVARPQDTAYVLKFLRETCYAGVMHALCVVLSFTALFLPFKTSLVLPLCATNAFLQLLPVMVQRYNRPKLVRLYRFNERKEQNAAEKQREAY